VPDSLKRKEDDVPPYVRGIDALPTEAEQDELYRRYDTEPKDSDLRPKRR
jgi:hypothetical protein